MCGRLTPRAPGWRLAGLAGRPGGGARGQMGLRAACACAMPCPLPHFFLLFYGKVWKGAVLGFRKPPRGAQGGV
jgi:hypothetical protein